MNLMFVCLNILLVLILKFSCSTQVSENCGKSYGPRVVPNKSKRIVGGSRTGPGTWPWQVSLRIRDRHNCGGALINTQWILTAGHCLFGKDVDTLSAALGIYKLPKKDDFSTVVKIQKVVIHPAYDDDSLENDIGLAQLDHPVTFSHLIQRVCLPTNTEIPDGTIAYITGFGETMHKVVDDPKYLMQAAVPIFAWEKCEKLQRRMYNEKVVGSNICTMAENVTINPCFRDSGGPLVVFGNFTWTQYGVVSWGPGDCATGPSVYTKVSVYLNWIQTVIK